jgi:hypothetical protein
MSVLLSYLMRVLLVCLLGWVGVESVGCGGGVGVVRCWVLRGRAVGRVFSGQDIIWVACVVA